MLAAPFQGGAGPSHSNIAVDFGAGDALDYLPEEGNKVDKVITDASALHHRREASPPRPPSSGQVGLAASSPNSRSAAAARTRATHMTEVEHDLPKLLELRIGKRAALVQRPAVTRIARVERSRRDESLPG